MNQTRTFLIFALLAVAYLLFMAWEKDYGPQPPAVAAAPAAGADNSVPGATSSTAAPAAVPGPAAEGAGYSFPPGPVLGCAVSPGAVARGAGCPAVSGCGW